MVQGDQKTYCEIFIWPSINSSSSSITSTAASNKSFHPYTSLYAADYESTSDSLLSQLAHVRHQQQVVLGTELKNDPDTFNAYLESPLQHTSHPLLRLRGQLTVGENFIYGDK